MLGAEAMDAVLVGRDTRSSRLEGAPEAYRPVAHRQRRHRHCTNPFSERLRGERGGGQHRLPGGPRGGERLPRLASSTARIGAASAAPPADASDREPAPRASASKVLTPVTGMFRACANPRAVAMPMRRPVKLPGPTPTASRVTSSQPTPAAASASSAAPSRRAACAGRSPGAGSSRTSNTAPSRSSPATVDEVAVSSPRTITRPPAAGRHPRARARRGARPAARRAARRARGARATPRR